MVTATIDQQITDLEKTIKEQYAWGKWNSAPQENRLAALKKKRYGSFAGIKHFMFRRGWIQ